jgi:hypothetical protein
MSFMVAYSSRLRDSGHELETIRDIRNEPAGRRLPRCGRR